jgi:8-oxo-dGTP pyrophosphatase MutT (NUDIX family)
MAIKPKMQITATRRQEFIIRTDRAMRLQYGILPYRFTKTNSAEVLLITTRQSGRWIIPKGWPIKGLNPAKSAAREAYEEAGIRGTVSAKPVGAFVYEKCIEENCGTVQCEVRVFAMFVKRQFETWPEVNEREARWFAPRHALSAIRDGGLRELMASFFEKQIAGKSSRRSKLTETLTLGNWLDLELNGYIDEKVEELAMLGDQRSFRLPKQSLKSGA